MKSPRDATIGPWSDRSLVRVLESSAQEARMQDHHTGDEVGPRPEARATSPLANFALLRLSVRRRSAASQMDQLAARCSVDQSSWRARRLRSGHWLVRETLDRHRWF